MDIAWFGVLNGTAISFMAIFATRQGAAGFEIGLLNAVPAIVSLGVTLPAGQWLQKRPLSRAVFWTSVWHRLFYLAWVFLPFFLAPYLQVWALIALVFLMSIPGTFLAVGFNSLFAEVVPPEWRSHVVGVRNALLALVFIVTTLLSGIILDRMPFPEGYQVVFAIGFVGAMMSSLHLYLIRLPQEPTRRVGRSLGDWAHPGALRTWVQEARLSVGLRFFARGRLRPSFDLHLLRTPFGLFLGLLFGFHLAQYLAIPLFPLFWVNELKLTDTEISMGNAVFYATVLLGSTQLARLTARSSHKQVLVMGVILMSLYPAMTAVTINLPLFLLTSAVGGVAWSMTGGVTEQLYLREDTGGGTAVSSGLVPSLF
ncbi:MAG: MFS transporter [Anaerolineae bacterium]|nr:MFS transporter [Anaerolineae bacterium]